MMCGLSYWYLCRPLGVMFVLCVYALFVCDFVPFGLGKFCLVGHLAYTRVKFLTL